MAKVSVIIPVYNVEDYLVECLESVINQTYTNLEILCINDCSTDCSLAILNEYALRDSRIIVLENEINGGQAYTRNIGLKKATGEYILFVDADDTICMDLLESCMKVSSCNDMVCFDYKQIAEGKEYPRQFAYKMKDGLYNGELFFSESVDKKSVIFAPWSKLYSRNFLLENHISFYSGIIYEDVLFSFHCYTNAKRVYNLNRKLYEYRIRKCSTMTKDITGQNIESYIICICELTRLYLRAGFNSELSLAVEGYIRKVCREYISAYRKWGTGELEPKLLKDKPEYLKLYRTFSELFIRPGKLLDFNQRQIEEIRQYPYVILYGAGDIARSAVEILDQYDIPIYGIAVSSGHKNKKSLLGNQVRELQDYHDVKERCLVLIGTIPRYYSEIREQLCENGFLHCMELIEVNEEAENGR